MVDPAAPGEKSSRKSLPSFGTVDGGNFTPLLLSLLGGRSIVRFISCRGCLPPPRRTKAALGLWTWPEKTTSGSVERMNLEAEELEGENSCQFNGSRIWNHLHIVPSQRRRQL